MNEKKLENATIELTIEVPENRVELEFKNVYDLIQKSAKIDGFRRGKAPVHLVEQKYKQQADKEVTENLLRTLYIDAVTEKKITPIGNPWFDFKTANRGNNFSFSARVEIPPTVELADYKGHKVEERACEIRDDDVDGEIQAMREKKAEITKKEDGQTVQKGDLVTLLVKQLTDDSGAETVDSDYKQFSILVGKTDEEYTFDRYITGMKKDEEKEIEIKYPKKYQVEELSGKKIKYSVKISDLNNMILPELNDDFARSIGEFTTLQELKSKTKENLQKYVNETAKREVKSKLLKEIVEKSSYDIPGSMIQKEMSAIFAKLQQRIGLYSEDLDDFASKVGIKSEELAEQLRKEAMDSIKSTLTLTEISQKEALQVDQNRYRAVIELMASRNNLSLQDTENLIEEKGARENIESELLLEQALDFIYDHAQVKKNKAVTL